ncbi:unnamed protein product [Mytilus coruscus]|uniref:Fibrinogen C-terminal domain-containing protein n=1 Tax=Mytilus coruscus TaxID=42192 RepID=A0A6J8DAN2_MYTCO|nr:unnamed protein product [Mytilus coruscus]
MCKSINFIASNKTCQINHAEPGKCYGELLESDGNSFAAASTFPKELAGTCQDHDCNLNEVCMPKGITYYCFPWTEPFAERNFTQIFVACAGNQQSVLDTWKNPCTGMDFDIENIKNPCTNMNNRHIRSTMIDKWDVLPIDQVKIELFKNGELAVEIYFDGRGSTNSDWFSKNRLRSNSYNDMTQLSTFNIFSMDGDQNYDRHLFISNRYGTCNQDRGWLLVVDTADANYRYCRFDKLPGKPYPYILYGPDQQMVRFNYGRSGTLIHD